MKHKEIYIVPKERKYWVVRANSGKYYDHFTRFGLIALGHIDELNTKGLNETPFTPNKQKIIEIIKNINEDNKSKISQHTNQVTSFIHEMKIGDWVLTVGSEYIRFGRVISHPFISENELKIEYGIDNNKHVVKMEHKLRRRVQWGPGLNRENLPYGLLQSLRAKQTLFNVDNHWDAIYHSLYPYFIRDDKLYLSAKINTKERVKNYSIASFLSIISEIEVICKGYESGIDHSNFDNKFNEFIREDKLTVTTKAEFHSPGEIWNVISGVAENQGSWIPYTVAIYSMIFGNEKLGFDGIIDIETRRKMWDLVIDRMKKRNANDLAKDLELTAPNSDTHKLEDSSKDEK